MSKLTYDDKIKLYNDRKSGMSVSSVSKKYNVSMNVVNDLISLIDKHGFGILRTTKNRTFTPHEKERIINRVILNHESVRSVAIDEGLLSKGMLQNWIKEYKEMGYNIVERKRGDEKM